ncbi:hypothetical protein NDA18_004310 [Ustilago nuda]|nr:hypothetical protein NDA18_004310 [Ustilago nuda]
MPPNKTATAAATASTRSRPTRAAATKAVAAAVAPTTAKSNGKKRAAADEADSTPAKKNAAATTKSKANKAAPATEADEEDLEVRDLIASLSDVSANSSDQQEQDDIQDEANSSDEDDEDDRLASTTLQPRSSLAFVKLPNSKDDAVVRARLDKLAKSKSSSKGASTTPGVLYIGRLPKGFFEKQLKSYLSQFGHVSRLRVSRNKKTGASKHYAFVEFADKDVAQIVQETMHNYLIDGRLLQVKVLPKDKVHPELWVGANRMYRAIPTARVERVVRSRDKTEEEQQRTNQRALKRQDERKHKLKNLGIDYDFQGYTKDDGAAPEANKAPAAKAKTTKTKTTKTKTTKARVELGH